MEGKGALLLRLGSGTRIGSGIRRTNSDPALPDSSPAPDKERNGLHVACQSWLIVATWSAVLRILRPTEGSVGDSALIHHQCLLECAGVEGQV